MLSRRSICRLRLPLLTRYQSTYVHPVSKLGQELSEQLASGDTNELYSSLKDHLEKFSNEMTDPTTLQRSFGLNGPLVQFLKKSATDGESHVDPYQILNTLCDYKVARSPHFEIVLKHLLLHGSPQDVIALWVKYLETIAENPNAVSRSFNNRNGNNDSHQTNIALASIAYLMLPDVKPDFEMLCQILQLDQSSGQRIPFNKIKFLINSLFIGERKEQLTENAKTLFHQYVNSDKESFLRQLDDTLQFHHLQDLYNQYSGGSAEPEIIAKFMEKFLLCNNASGAVKIFNENKALDSSLLKNMLLIAVAALPANTRNVRLDRILAIWNSLIKPTGPSASSYASLIRALGDSKNFGALQKIWDEEISEELKKDSVVLESYLTAILKDNDTAKFDEIAGKLPADIKSIDLINAVLSKMLKNKISNEKFDAFFAAQFAKKEDSSLQKRPNVETLAIRMWANYHYATDKESFDFLKSIFQSKKNVLKVNAIIENFIRVVPSIDPIHKLFPQVKEPLDTRKYGAFINAEFTKPGGSYERAEQIFKNFLEDSRPHSKKIDRFVLEPLICGFSELAITERDPSFLLKVSTYYTFASKVNLDLTYQTIARILHSLAMVARENSGKFNTLQQQFVDLFLKDMSSMKNFSPNTRDIETLRKANVKVGE
ncbi:hypothetical protein HG537_0F04790 [Torulaspora globosa]|uniref:Meiotic sister-chromatid recombination protein 6, mitochondrial n=1 Tax=Torulaspora globosa TaxID=48254 RepID=A0A7H9HVF8_9SACH|nr:hypothetical protein HG537_0F04790 [Torulaspora sp. CBS 2947]